VQGKIAMDPLYIPVVAILMPLALVPTIVVMKHRHQRRKWEHLERLKSIEVQSPMPMRQALERVGGISAIGAGVPVVSVLAAFLTTLLWEAPLPSDDAAAVPGIAWGCAVLISIGAMITSLKLASMHHAAWRESASASSADNRKPVYDPDAFDVVSSRG
jgi:hypothetical protein